MSIQGRPYENRTNEDLLREYQVSQSLEIKQELVMRYLYVVESAAVQMRDVYLGFAQVEDIINEGVITLMNSIDRFDSDKNVKFESYIYKRIRGMVIDLARKQDWVPRSLRKNARDIKETYDRLATELGRTPEKEEVAETLGITIRKLDETVSKQNLFSVLSLDMVLDGSEDNKQTTQVPSKRNEEQPEEKFLEGEMRQMLASGIHALKENEQMVISLYYVDELNMKQIAEVMEISEPRVSQIHSNAIKKLRAYMKKNL